MRKILLSVLIASVCVLISPTAAAHLTIAQGKALSGEAAAGNAQALAALRQDAGRGDDIAQFALGVLYDSGWGVPQNYRNAAQSYRKAAEQGNARAQNNLGFLYEMGRGVPRNYAKALKWLREAAQQGNANAQNSLGFMYAKGRGVPQSYVEAYRWYVLSKAAAKPGSEVYRLASQNMHVLATRMSPTQIAQAQQEVAEWAVKHSRGQ